MKGRKIVNLHKLVQGISNNKSKQLTPLGFSESVQWQLNFFLSWRVTFYSKPGSVYEERGVKSSSLSSVLCTFVHLVLSWNRARNAKGHIINCNRQVYKSYSPSPHGVRTEGTLKEKELSIYFFFQTSDRAAILLAFTLGKSTEHVSTMECAANKINHLRVTLKRDNVWCVISLLACILTW